MTIKEKFLENVKNHKLEVRLNHTAYKHLTFRQRDSENYNFDLMVYPNTLVITGDMGSTVFSRNFDMLGFFRDTDKKLGIRPNYWSEKIIAEDPSHEVYRGKEWNTGAFYTSLREDIENKLSEYPRQQITKVYNTVLDYLKENEVDSHNWQSLLQAFDCKKLIEGLEFGYCEYDTTDFNYHYLWRCYAIVWGIQKYDEFLDSLSNSTDSVMI